MKFVALPSFILPRHQSNDRNRDIRTTHLRRKRERDYYRIDALPFQIRRSIS